jgi:hypothetical protein
VKTDFQCDWRHDCKAEVTHIGNKGYLYCAQHAIGRRNSGYERTRKMTNAELKALHAGEALIKY